MRHIKAFDEWLVTEAPVAYRNDFGGNKVKLGSITRTVMDKYYKKLKTIESKPLPREDIEIYMIHEENKAVIGFWDKNEFIIMAELYLTKYKNLDGFGYKNVLQTSEVQTVKSERGSGYGSSLYLSLIEAGYTLISDYSQFDGARNLWRSISKKVNLDVFDEIEYTVTKEHKIIHTDIHNLDKEWSCAPDNSCDNILFIAFK